MTIHHLTVEEAYRSLQSGPGGLRRDMAAQRLIEYGPNEVEAAEELRKFVQRHIHRTSS